MEIDTKKFTTMVVGFAVAILLVTTLMVPVISSLSSDSDSETYTNTGEFYYNSVKNDTEEHTIQISSDGTNATITSDGEVVYQYAIADMIDVPLVYGDNFVYMVHGGNNLMVYGAANIIGEMGNGYGINSGQSYSLITNGYVVGALDGEDINPYPMVYPQDPEMLKVIGYITANSGDLVLADNPTVFDSTHIVATNYTSLGEDIATWGSGTVESMSLPQDYGNPVELTLNSTQISDRAYSIEDLTATIDYGGGSSSSITASYFFVPVQIGESGGSGISNTLLSLISIIPLITVVGIVISAVSIIRRN